MGDEIERDASRSGGEGARRLLVWGVAVAVVAFGLLCHVNAFGNRALFHHVPNPYSDPVLHNSMLRSPRLLPRVFTGEFLLSTAGRYRPFGYLMFGLTDAALHLQSDAAWHVVLAALHAAAGALVFLTLRTLLRDPPAAVLAAGYLAHPVFVPLTNDVNMVYLLWGLLFSVGALWLLLQYLQRRSPVLLLVWILAFAACVLSFSYAIVLPAHFLALCLFHNTRSRAAAALALLTVAAFVAGVLGASPLYVVLGALAVVLIFAGVAGVPHERYLEAARLSPPCIGVIVLLAFVRSSLQTGSVLDTVLVHLNEVGMLEPFDPRFVWRHVLRGSTLHLISLAIAVLIPLAVTKVQRWRDVPVAAVPVAFLVFVTLQWNRVYADDVRYWEKVRQLAPSQCVVELNLAKAHLAAGHWETARELLMHLAYETEPAGAAFDMAVQSRLARAYEGLGNDKVAGFYFFSTKAMVWKYRLMKNLLMEAADFSFRTGYLSSAEFNWACGLVLDNYDVRLYNNLGRALVYKNFFRAAARHFRYVLSLQPRNDTALYYMAFISHLEGKRKDYEAHVARWQAATGASTEPEFQPIYDAYRFDREGMLAWFSDNPELIFAHRDEYVVTYAGHTYRFWEVPYEVGCYFANRNEYGKAAYFFSQSLAVNPAASEPREKLAELYHKMRNSGADAGLERLLEAGSHEAGTE